jgi:acetyl esterase/lipase
VRPIAATLLLALACEPSLAQEVHKAKPMPPFEEMVRMPVVYRVPGMDKVVVRRNHVYKTAGKTPLELDVYMPAGLAPGERRAAVVFVHGGPVPPELRPKDWGAYVSYGGLAAASGLIGITFNHRFNSPAQVPDAAGDVAELIEHVRGNAEAFHVDPDRLALWAFSGGGLFLSATLAERPGFVRAVVAYYAVLDLQIPPPGQPDTLGPEVRKRFSPVAQLTPGPRPLPPILVARAGQDYPFLNDGLDRFVREALAQNLSLDLLNHPEGRHAFDILDDDARSREIISRTLEFLRAQLGS